MKEISILKYGETSEPQRMTSLEIAELTGKQHKNVMQAIRNMEPAWEKITGLKFQLCEKTYQLANGVSKMRAVGRSAHCSSADGAGDGRQDHRFGAE